MNIKATTDAAKKVFGQDINIMLVRSPAYGHSDSQFVVRGRRQMDVAKDLVRFIGNQARIKQVTKTRVLDDSTYLTTEITF